MMSMGEDYEMMSMGEDYDMSIETVEVHGEIRRETDKAILFYGGNQEVWMPKSQIDHQEDNKDGTCTLEIPEWLALEKGLI